MCKSTITTSKTDTQHGKIKMEIQVNGGGDPELNKEAAKRIAAMIDTIRKERKK